MRLNTFFVNLHLQKKFSYVDVVHAADFDTQNDCADQDFIDNTKIPG